MDMICPICHSKELKGPILRYVSPFDEEKYKLHRCMVCNLMVWFPLKMKPLIYGNEMLYHYEERHRGFKQVPWYGLLATGILKAEINLLPLARQLNLLDIGCGDGIITAAFQKLGFSVLGIDLDSKSAEIAAQRGINVIKCAFDSKLALQIYESGLNFDVITFFEVLEHQDNPREFIDSVKKILTTKGFIIGSVPNRNRFGSVYLRLRVKRGDINYHFDLPPHHFFWWNKKSLQYFLKKTGFSNTKIKVLHAPYGLRSEWYKKALNSLLPFRQTFEINSISNLLGFIPFGLGQHLFFLARKDE